ncbi:hypothetical protein [Candidatus Poriferisodalis sp.]|uniref:hypothetical protein n=1 Tax=Candidatus Poriferisodalis sp. TaxID=3101277 RepID=UPI003D0A4D07
MSLSLEVLADAYAFESSPRRMDLGVLHVPFDELTDGAETEARLDASIRRREPVALIGASGCGKSSVIAHVLGPTVEGVVPVYVPVAAAPAQTADTADHLADHLLTTFSRLAEPIAGLVERDLARSTTTTTRVRRGRAGFAGRWLGADVAGEVRHQTQTERNATLADKTDALVQVLAIVADGHLVPVIVFDDTDRWLSNENAQLVTNFFAEGVRWLLELPAALVVAVHPHYFEVTSQAELLCYLDTRINIPRLESATAVDAILRRRIDRIVGAPNPNLTDVLASDASAAVLAVYRESGSLRRALQVCHTALHDALSDGVEQISARHVVAAASAG